LVNSNSTSELEQGLCSHSFDVALLDLSVLQPDAAASMSVLRWAFPSLPIVLFVNLADNQGVAECLAMGARHFLLKEFRNEKTIIGALQPAVTNHGEERLVSSRPVAGRETARLELATVIPARGKEHWTGRIGQLPARTGERS